MIKEDCATLQQALMQAPQDAKQLSKETPRSITGCQIASHEPASSKQQHSQIIDSEDVSSERRPYPRTGHLAVKWVCDAACDAACDGDHILHDGASRLGQEAGDAAAADDGAADKEVGSANFAGLAAGNKSRKRSREQRSPESSPAGEAAAKRPRSNGTREACLVVSASPALGTSPLLSPGHRRKNI